MTKKTLGKSNYKQVILKTYTMEIGRLNFIKLNFSYFKDIRLFLRSNIIRHIYHLMNL